MKEACTVAQKKGRLIAKKKAERRPEQKVNFLIDRRDER
tara:strand:+ start:1532 stop:1648 length:117 start_codon:yes stop_codon:yes gene_type:complete